MLLIDDEAALVQALRIVLQGSHEIAVETSAFGGLDRILSAEEPFDAILCDLAMPGKDGVDLYEEVRELRPGLERRIIFMTGGAFTPRAARFLAGIPNTTIEKPFEIASINEAVARVFDAVSVVET